MRLDYLVSAVGMFALATGHGAAQQSDGKPTPAAAEYSGCVAKLAQVERYVLASGGRCMLLDGNFKVDTIADRTVTLQGILVEGTGNVPLTLQVKSTVAVKNACTQTCELEPPGARSVHPRNKEHPGSEGGPPGEKKTPPSTPPGV